MSMWQMVCIVEISNIKILNKIRILVATSTLRWQQQQPKKKATLTLKK